MSLLATQIDDEFSPVNKTTYIQYKFFYILGRIPTINENPTDQSVSRGDPATLNCGARGQPEPFVSWYKDGVAVDLESAPDHMVLLPDGALFFLRTVENARQQDSGLYHCKVGLLDR